MPEIALGVDGIGGGNAKIEDEEGHGYGENAVVEGGEALDVLSGNAVLEGRHRREFTGISESSKEIPRLAKAARSGVLRVARDDKGNQSPHTVAQNATRAAGRPGRDDK